MPHIRPSIPAVAVAVLAVLGAACKPPPSLTPEPSGAWVVENVHYSGPRGQNGPGGTGEHWVTCIPKAELTKPRTQRTKGWREVRISARHAYDGTYEPGTPCPAGVIRASYGPER